MSFIKLSHPTKIIKGTIELPASKSISNRALVLKHVLHSDLNIQNLSTADDTHIMQEALQQGNGTMNVKNAGTCMRFLTAYFAAKPNCDVTLLCDERMEKRPVSELVDSLKQLGADITYLKEAGFPPINIKGKELNGGSIQLSASASSQFVSAMMMIAPLCKTDLTIELTGEVTSQPYIEMTAEMMRIFGIEIVIVDYKIIVRKSRQLAHHNHLHSHTRLRYEPQTTNHKPQTTNFQSPTAQTLDHKPHIIIESDWSAASYWYELVALSKDAEITLPHLSLNSLQGDRVIAEYMKQFGVETIVVDDGIVIKKSPQSIDHNPQLTSDSQEFIEPKTSNIKPQTLNLTHFPDLTPTLASTAAAQNADIILTGLQNLVIKESNRLAAIEKELSKLGFDITATENTLAINPKQTVNSNQQTTNIQTYSDHRMAMAFAPLALVFDDLIIEHPEVVEKSYPHFWEDLRQIGFVIQQ